MKTNKKVLVIDDEAAIRRVTEIKLQKAGYEVLSACNGQEGLGERRGLPERGVHDSVGRHVSIRRPGGSTR